MDKLLFALLPAGITAIVAIALAYISMLKVDKVSKGQQVFELEKLKRAEMTARAEELYSIVASWQNNMFSMHAALIPVMKGEMSYNDYLDIINGMELSPKHDFKRLDLLVDAYFPNTRKAYGKAKLVRDHLSDINFKYKESYLAGDQVATKYIQPLNIALSCFEKASEELKENIVSEIVTLN